MTRQRPNPVSKRRSRNSILDWGSRTTYRRSKKETPGRGEFERYEHLTGYGYRRKPGKQETASHTKKAKGEEFSIDVLNSIAKSQGAGSFKSLSDPEKELVRSLARRMQNPRLPLRSTAKTALHWYDKGVKTAYDWTAGLPSRIGHSLLENPMHEHHEHCGCHPNPPHVWVTYASPTDALGRKRPGWYVMDHNYFTSRHETKEEAERNAAALWQIRGGHGPWKREVRENPAFRISTKDPATMTAGEINKELDKLDQLSSQNTDAMIEAGRGHERTSDYLPPKPGDVLAAQANAIYDRRSDLLYQIEREYGPGRPVRFPSGWRRSLKKNPKTKLELILDQVVAGKREVTFDVHGYTEEQKKRIIDAAHERGLHASGGGDHILVRDLRNIQRNSRRNPEASADRMYEIFHGKPPDTDIIVEEEIHEHEHLATLGKMVSLKVETRSGYVVEIGWSDDDFHPYLACNEQGTQLYIEGGDQSIDLGSFKMDGAKWKKDLMVIGDIVELTYQTEKDFDKFETIDYYHKLNDPDDGAPNDGDFPQLVYDPLSKADKSSRNGKMYISGGTYHIEHDGIIG